MTTEDIASAFAPFGKSGVEQMAVPIASTYKVEVPYKGDTTIRALVAPGKYNWANSDITDKHFPQQKRESEKIEVELVHFNCRISTDDALKRLDRQGLRPLNAAEILAFGIAHPDVQREFPIVALGQRWRYSLGRRYHVVYLFKRGIERHAYLEWIDEEWLEHCRFAAVRK